MSTFMSGVRGKLLGFGGGFLLLMATGVTQANSVTYVYTDPQGTPLAEADVNGNITATFDYAPYGSIAMGTAPNGPGYTGHVNDPDTQLVYMQARYYDPAVGRFLSLDPVGPAAGNPYNFNRFAYANNNPIVNTDPSGKVTGSLINPDGGGVAGPGYTMFVNPSSSGGGGGKTQQKTQQESSPYDASNREANVVYHETAALKPVDGSSSSDDLHQVRVAAAHVYNNLNDKSKFQDTGTLNDQEQKAMTGGYPPAIRAYKDSVGAVSEAGKAPDNTDGSRHFFVRDVTAGGAQRVPSWANGNQIVYGPFKTTAGGDGPIQAGDTVYLWINNTK